MSDVSKTLSVQPDHYQNVCAMARSKEQQSKQVFTDAVNYCMKLLRQTGRITDYQNECISDEATMMGLEMFERIINIDVQMDVKTEDKDSSNILEPEIKLEPDEYLEDVPMEDFSTFIKTEETPCAAASTSCKSSKIQQRHSESSPKVKTEIPTEEYYDSSVETENLTLCNSSDVRERKKLGSKLGVKKPLIPLEEKMEVIALARAHPSWSLKMLQTYGSPRLLTMEQLKTWEKHVDNGGTFRDKITRINNATYERFVNARATAQHVTVQILKTWAIEAARFFYGASFNFDGGHNWFVKFKKVYGLHGSPAHGYYTKEEPMPELANEELRLIEEESNRTKKRSRYNYST